MIVDTERITRSSSHRNKNDLCSKDLKEVIYKNKYFPDDCLREKSRIINKLLKEEKQRLKLNGDTDSEEENAIADQERKKILEKEKFHLFYEYDKIKVKKIKIKKAVQHFPRINKHNIRKYMSLLSSETNISSCKKSLKLCQDHMHTSAKPLWTSPSSIMKAVKHCLLNRNWNNLTHLILFLINLPSERYKPLIRHLCQIVDKLHHVVQENNLQGQLSLVHQANRSHDRGNTTVIIPQ